MTHHPIRYLIQIVESAGQENVPAVLYHGTSIFNLLAILHSGGLTTSNQYAEDDEVTGVPTTEDPLIARWFGVNSTRVWFEAQHGEIPEANAAAIADALYAEPARGFSGAILTLNGAALARAYEVRPVSVENQEGLDEKEWRVVTKAPLPLSFVTGFRVDPREVAFLAELLRRAPSAGWHGETPGDVEALLRHPKAAK